MNGGSFHARSDGTAAAELTAAVMARASTTSVVITRRSSGGVRGAEVMRGKLDVLNPAAEGAYTRPCALSPS